MGRVLPWQTVANANLSDLTLMFKGPYTVAVVCMHGSSMLFWQASHTVKDGPTLQTPCNNQPLRTVNVTLAQDGSVHLGDVDGTPMLATPRSFTVQVPDGTYDLIASDPDDMKALIQRDVMVAASGTTPPIGSVNVQNSGVALTSVTSLTLDNPPKPPDPMDPPPHFEMVAAHVGVTTKNNSIPGDVFVAPYNLDTKKVNAFAYPTLNPDDAQSATFTGTDNFNPNDPTDPDMKTATTTRSQTRPLDADVMAGKTTFQLPAPIRGPTWKIDSQLLSVALPPLPTLDDLTVSASGLAADGTTNVEYQINITSSFFKAASLARPVFDTTLSGFPAASQIDFTKRYTRDIVSQRDLFDDADNVVGHETSQFHEDVN